MIPRSKYAAFATWVWVGMLAGGCASVPAKRYGITDLQIEGMKHLDEAALKACLATTARTKPGFDISANPDPECGERPFDASHVHLHPWPAPWPWSTWPVFDRSVFERDLDRVTRWYRARGFYHARVTATLVNPPEAMNAGAAFKPCDPDDPEVGCTLQAQIFVMEGEPVRIRSVALRGIDVLPVQAQNALREAVSELRAGKRFDEADYNATKDRLLRTVRNLSYAKAVLVGTVGVDKAKNEADVTFTISPGLPCFFGDVHVQVDGSKDIPGSVVVRAASISRGTPFSVDAVEEAQRAIYGLGAFSSVEVEPLLDTPGQYIPVEIEVTPGRLFRYGIGAGIMSGLTTRLEGYSTPVEAKQWDIHLLTFLEFRNAFGGLQRVRLEERPRLVFPQRFPSARNPVLGNILTLQSLWPNFIEGRTSLFAGAQWDIGPDIFGLEFQRNAIDASIGPQRRFRVLNASLFSSVGLHYNLFFPFNEAQDLDIDPVEPGEQKPVNYRVMFIEGLLRLDGRDSTAYTRKGYFLGLRLNQAFYVPEVSYWTYLQALPDARGYVNLPLGLVLASRFGLGFMHVFHFAQEATTLDEPSQRLGPYAYRLRGGGATSNRGFTPFSLGEGVQGGLRKWEASVEVRIRLTSDFGSVVFVDAGDVLPDETLRFDRPQVSTGVGLRYHTIVGPIRLDVGYRIPGLQNLGGPPLPQQNTGLFGWPIVFNFTIGEAY
jgi:hypothetical protein